MDPWLTVALFGIAIFGFAWLTPARRKEEFAGGGSDPAYDQLLEELETENRELLDAVTKFKHDQDETVKNLVKQIQVLERQMNEMSAVRRSGAIAEAVVAAEPAETPAEPPVMPSAERPNELFAAAVAEQVPAASKAVVAAAAPLPIRERYAGLLAQHRSGRSVEQIAKSAGMNKGEVQLILQLAKREDNQLA